MKDVQCYELFGGIAPKNHAFSFSFHLISWETKITSECNGEDRTFTNI